MSMDKTMIGKSPTVIFAIHAEKKKTKWGVKLWVCADADPAHIYSFEVYTGKLDLGVEQNIAYNVIHLLKDLLDRGGTFYTDNFTLVPFSTRGSVPAEHVDQARSIFRNPFFQELWQLPKENQYFSTGILTCGWWLLSMDFQVCQPQKTRVLCYLKVHSSVRSRAATNRPMTAHCLSENSNEPA